MAIIAKATGDGSTFEPAPEGVHRAVCVDVIDKGMLDVTWQGKTTQQHKISLAWQIDEMRDDGKPYLVYRRYTLSLGDKANLRKDLESWRGRPFTREELAGFDVETVIGASCLLNVTRHTVGDKTYANVGSVMPLMKGMEKMRPVPGYVRVCDREPEQTAGTIREPGIDDEVPPYHMTADDIPFAWLLPLVLPTVGALSALVA